MAGIKRARRRLAEQLERQRLPGEGYRPQVTNGTPTSPPDRDTAGIPPTRRPDPNPVKRTCTKCERIRAYVRRMLAKARGTGE